MSSDYPKKKEDITKEEERNTYEEVISQCHLCQQEQENRAKEDAKDSKKKRPKKSKERNLPCGDPLLVEARSNTWCHALKFKGVSIRTLMQLQRRLPVLYPWDEKYGDARMEYNKWVNQFPAVIVYVENENQVRKSIAWARKHEVPVSIRSGGHSTVGFSVGTGMVIDVSRMNKVVVNEEARTARIQAGALLGPVILELQKYGLVLPTGTCPNVGVAGLTLGGGVGFLDRKLGLTCDSLLSVTMVLADGTIVVADENNHSDLFWACQGAGGGNYGIVTEFSFRLYPLTSVILFEYEYDWDVAEQAIALWQKWAPFADRSLAVELALGGPFKGVFLSGQWDGKSKKLRHLIEELDVFGNPKSKKVWRASVANAARFHTDKNTRPPYHNAKSDIMYEPLNQNGIKTLVRVTSKIGPSATFDYIVLSALGGAVGDRTSVDSAFLHREAIYWIEYVTYWSDQLDGFEKVKWINDAYEKMRPYVSGFVYVNFPDLTLRDWKWAYWGPNYERLSQIKTQYDPTDFFHQPQGIRPFGVDEDKNKEAQKKSLHAKE